MGQSRARSFRRWFTARPLVVAAAVVTAVGLLVPVVVVGSSDSETPAGATVVLVLLLLIALFLVVNVLIRLAGIDDDADRIAARLADEPVQQRLLARWLSRARWARFIGGFSGVLVWVLGTSVRGDVLLLGTLGIGLGALAAESHHVRARRGPRTVSLEVRTLAQYLPRADGYAMAAVAGLAVLAALAGVVHAPSRSGAAWGAAAFAFVAAARWAQLRVVRRPRPALPEGLVWADDLARHLAVVRGLARPAVYVGLVLSSQALYGLEPLLGSGAARLLAAVARLTAFALWVRNRRLGLDGVLRQPAGAVVAA